MGDQFLLLSSAAAAELLISDSGSSHAFPKQQLLNFKKLTDSQRTAWLHNCETISADLGAPARIRRK